MFLPVLPPSQGVEPKKKRRHECESKPSTVQTEISPCTLTPYSLIPTVSLPLVHDSPTPADSLSDFHLARDDPVSSESKHENIRTSKRAVR